VRYGQPTDIIDFHHHSIRENLSAWITGLKPNWSLQTHAAAHLWESKGTGVKIRCSRRGSERQLQALLHSFSLSSPFDVDVQR